MKWSELCCALVPQPQTHWLVCAQPLFPSVNTRLDQSTSSSSSSSFHGPDLVAKRQYLGRTPTCYHNDALTHTQILDSSSQIQQQILKSTWIWMNVAFQIKTSVFFPSYKCDMLSLTPFSDGHVTFVSLPAWYSCGMGLGCRPGSGGMTVFVFLPFWSSCETDHVTHHNNRTC